MKSIYNQATEVSKLINPKEVEKYTHSSKWLIRQEAIKRLGEIGDSISVKRLIKMLKTSQDKYDIIYAISSLGKLKDKSAVQILLKYVDSRNSDVANGSIYALGEIGDKSVIPYLEKRISSPRLKIYIEEALKKLRRSRSLLK